jgi:hypothetical protein
MAKVHTIGDALRSSTLYMCCPLDLPTTKEKVVDRLSIYCTLVEVARKKFLLGDLQAACVGFP